MDDRSTPTRWDAVVDFFRTFGPRITLGLISLLAIWTSSRGTARTVVVVVVLTLWVIKITYEVRQARRSRYPVT